MFTLIIADLEFTIHYSELEQRWKHWSNANGAIDTSYSFGEVLSKIDAETKSWKKHWFQQSLLGDYYTQLEVYRGYSQWPITEEFIDDGF